mmetsp:Transcript_77871/g.167023  ORF Transcript_77871/g.167023 Transcript_77871/m.167023 type:complete len:268 (-) Transcript_77871:228-1031(-)
MSRENGLEAIDRLELALFLEDPLLRLRPIGAHLALEVGCHLLLESSGLLVLRRPAQGVAGLSPGPSHFGLDLLQPHPGRLTPFICQAPRLGLALEAGAHQLNLHLQGPLPRFHVLGRGGLSPRLELFATRHRGLALLLAAAQPLGEALELTLGLGPGHLKGAAALSLGRLLVPQAGLLETGLHGLQILLLLPRNALEALDLARLLRQLALKLSIGKAYLREVLQESLPLAQDVGIASAAGDGLRGRGSTLGDRVPVRHRLRNRGQAR